MTEPDIAHAVKEILGARVYRFYLGIQADRKPQTAVTRLEFSVAEISNFSKAFSSVKFSAFLFSQNTIQYKNTYRNCKVARESQRNKQNKMRYAE